MELDLQPIAVKTGSRDTQGRLAIVGGELVAVLVRLDDPVHGDERGGWFLEAGFGACDGVKPTPFRDLDEAKDWLARRLAG